MAINKPYCRIIRPFKGAVNNFFCDKKLVDASYRNYVRAFGTIEKDFRELIEYVEPCDTNKETYSLRIYELLFRACTEFEANAKAVLEANEYKKESKGKSRHNLNIQDYYKLNKAMKLSSYIVRLNIWEGGPKDIMPFANWNNGPSTLKWYKEYNSVKHNRCNCFNKANFYNLVEAIAAVYVMLYAQFGYFAFNAFQTTEMLSEDDGFICRENSLFSIKFNGTWEEQELYDFDLSHVTYQNFNFNE